jgi:hypothetical protein
MTRLSAERFNMRERAKDAEKAARTHVDSPIPENPGNSGATTSLTVGEVVKVVCHVKLNNGTDIKGRWGTVTRVGAQTCGVQFAGLDGPIHMPSDWIVDAGKALYTSLLVD